MKHRYASLLLKSHRTVKRLARSDVAKKLKVTNQFYGHIEKGNVGLPPKHFKKIIKILNIPESYLTDALLSDFLEWVNNYL